MVEIACELACRLSAFGQSEESQKIIAFSIEANAWFTREDICRSVESIRDQMLDDDKLRGWMQSYPALPLKSPSRVAIIMAGNIPLVGFFDLLCAFMAGCEVWIKPSSKDSVLMGYLCRLLREIEPAIPIYIYDEKQEYDAVIATGGSEANHYFAQRFKGRKLLSRGNRHSIAVLSGAETEQQMQLLSEDIYSYSGLGCRNVAMIFAPRGLSFELPQRETSQKYRNNYLQNRALLSMRGCEFVDNGSSIMVYSQELPSSLSVISIWEYDSIDEVEQWIKERDNSLQCIVSGCIEHSRRVDFGQAQQPTLYDYADGVDTMLFLEGDLIE